MHNIRNLLILTISVAAASVPALAQTQMDLNQQADQDFQKADQKLNAAYKKLTAKISPEGKAALQAAEQSWIKFRDQECAFETMGSAGGSIQPMEISECKTSLTKQRTAGLEKQADCQEGDLSCGGQ